MAPSKPLTPPDLTRCQAQIQRHHPFIHGGNVRPWERCDAAPTTIATERKPGADGQRGSMSLCDPCKLQLEKRKPGLATFAPIKPTHPAPANPNATETVMTEKTTKPTKPTKKTKHRRDPREERYQIRHTKPERKLWDKAAAAMSVDLSDWIRMACAEKLGIAAKVTEVATKTVTIGGAP